MSVTVTTQDELDAALANGTDTIYITSDAGVWLRLGATGSAHVEAWGSAHVEARGSAHVVARGSAHVEARGSAHVVAWDSAHVEARDSAHVEARGSAHVVARGSAHVVARDSAHVVAWGSAHVVAWGSAHVEARPFVAIHLHSARATVQGGVLIDIVSLDQSNPTVWCDMQGVEVRDGEAVVYKAVDADLKSGWGLAYPIGKTVRVLAKEWRADGSCGGGLHFGPTPRHAKDYFPEATRFLACAIPLSHSSGIPGGTAKIKARSCRVLFEVDVDGNPVGGAS